MKDKVFHEDFNLNSKVCIVCRQEIVGNYIYDKWGNKAHEFHKLQYCSSCGRILPTKFPGRYFHHPDGRTICNKCMASAVFDKSQIKHSQAYVRNLLTHAGFKGIPDEIDIKLTDKKTLTKMSGYKNIEGLTKIVKTVNSIKPTIVKQKVYILDYMPKIQFNATLAHEMLHIWVAHNNLDLGKYEEALCNIGSTLVFNYSKKHKLAHILNNYMKTNDDPDYGIRYMELKEKLKKYGWKQFINEIIKLSDYKIKNFR